MPINYTETPQINKYNIYEIVKLVDQITTQMYDKSYEYMYQNKQKHDNLYMKCAELFGRVQYPIQCNNITQFSHYNIIATQDSTSNITIKQDPVVCFINQSVIEYEHICLRPISIQHNQNNTNIKKFFNMNRFSKNDDVDQINKYTLK